MGVVAVFCDTENRQKTVKFPKFVIEIICIVKLPRRKSHFLLAKQILPKIDWNTISKQQLVGPWPRGVPRGE